MNDDIVVWIDGALRDPDAATVHWSDHGLTVGDGVFETIELHQGAPFALSGHLARLSRSVEGMRMAHPDPAQLERAVETVVRSWGERPGRLRITYTAGPGPMGSNRAESTPTLVVAAAPMRILSIDDPTDVLVVPYTRNERGALAGLKTTSYGENVVALDIAAQAGCSEALFANTRDELCEGTGSNVFVVLDERIITPPLDSGCLDGITRRLLLDALRSAEVDVSERPVPMSQLEQVGEAFLVSTGRHVQPIRRLGDRRLAACPGPLTVAAHTAWLTLRK